MPKVMSYVPILCVITLNLGTTFAFPSYQSSIPNGGNVANPCDTKETWSGLGHDAPEGAGPLNAFGRDFQAAGNQWTADLCRKDSDGDGKTNGEELGDLTCSWTKGQANPSGTITHPGVCEPIDSESCRSKNGFLETIEACSAKLAIEKKEFCPEVKTNPEVKSFDIRFNATVVPAVETTYMCQHFEVPGDQDYHVVAWEVLVDNRELMHHMVLGSCNTAKEEQDLLSSKLYDTPAKCGMTPPFCHSMAAVWAFGQEGRCYGSSSGVLMGNSTFRRVVMQIHYNNPSLKSGVVDSSGLRIYYTTKRRQYDTAMMNIGQMDFVIPPKTSATKVTGNAFTTSDCSQKLLGDSPAKYYMSSMLFHMHQLGTRAKVVLRKQGQPSQTLLDEAVTYDRPKMLVWDVQDSAPTFQAGDNLEVECTFNSSSKTTYTFFGEGTQDEMCMIFLEIYPRPKDVSYLGLLNLNDMNQCTWQSMQAGTLSTLKDNCELTKFGPQLAQTVALPNADSCMKFAGDYPSKACDSRCAAFITANNLTADACFTSPAIFRNMVAFSVVSGYAEAYQLQSHVDLCRQQLTGSNGGLNVTGTGSNNTAVHLKSFSLLLFTAIMGSFATVL